MPTDIDRLMRRDFVQKNDEQTYLNSYEVKFRQEQEEEKKKKEQQQIKQNQNKQPRNIFWGI